MAKDYYSNLGVSKNASAEEIKEAYKRLAKQYHPDVSKEKDAEEKFKAISEAYKVLSDPQKRQNYDQFGDAAERFSGFSGFEGFTHSEFDFSDLFGDNGFGDAFRDLFGQGFSGAQQRQRTGSARGQDIGVNMSVSFEEAVHGATKEFMLEHETVCTKCMGERTDEKDGKQKCTTCHGSGVQQSTQRTFFGVISTSTTCGKCRGEGTIITKPCQKCSGRGKEKTREKVSVKIPAGIDTGYRLRLTGHGNAGKNGGQTGDLYVLVFVEPHKEFKRDHDDIFMEAPLSFSQATLGGKIEVQTINGTAKVTVPPGTQTGVIFRLREEGVKNFRTGKTGDQYVKVILRTPEKLSKKQKELFDELGKEEGKKGKNKGFLGF
ncbi:MAG: molecular chaperone DnaJ [archaeon]|nr:molecular chaperone DnaJ [archaeon]